MKSISVSRHTLAEIQPHIPLELPRPDSFDLPEKILQFGTGVLLRGLPDYYIDQANKRGIFNGRIVMVKSTTQGDTRAFDAQDSMYTLCVRGLENGRKVEHYFLNNAVSRVLTAQANWDQILQLATRPEMQVVISNTTEIGIQLVADDVFASPPHSFPGKLLAFLYARYQAFNGDVNKGMVIIPTELVTDNGDKLSSILSELSQANSLPEPFQHWLEHCNTFCNSLVDRIVPGKLPEDESQMLEDKLGYRDELLISAEPYSLWAIETPKETTKELLGFAAAGAAPGILLSPDISKHRELKLRLLNGTHTFSCALAYLSGCDTVGKAMETPAVSTFIEALMKHEITPAISGEVISPEEALAFTARILDRFRNPFIIHKWLSIAVQYTSKMRMRNIPLLQAHYRKFQTPPSFMAKGFAAYLLFMRSEKKKDGTFQGTYGGNRFTIQDEYAELLYQGWRMHPDNPAETLLSDTRLWGTDLTKLPGFLETTEAQLKAWMKHPIASTP